jgi:hypothetical protein
MSMKPWQKHSFGLFLPLLIGVTVFSLAPEYDAPPWMINVSAAGIGIAIFYGMWLFTAWVRQRGNHVAISAVLVAVALIAWVVGQITQLATLTAFIGLLPVAIALFIFGHLSRLAEKSRDHNTP